MTVVEIIFDNRDKKYISGQNLNGEIRFLNHKPIKVTDLKVRIVGGAQVSWSETLWRDTKHYGEKISYFNQEFVLIASEKMVQLEDKYTFSFDLPVQIPSTHFGEYGHVKYYVEAEIRRPWKLMKKIRANFKVIRFVNPTKGFKDLCQPFKAQKPGSGITESSNAPQILGNRAFWDTPIGLTLNLNKTAFIPGEILEFKLEITNADKAIKEVTISLIQETEYHVRDFQVSTKRGEIEKLLQVKGPSIAAGETKIWDSALTKQNITIPELQPTDHDIWNIIKHQYYLQINLNMTYYIDSTEGRVKLLIALPAGENGEVTDEQDDVQAHEDEQVQDNEEEHENEQLSEQENETEYENATLPESHSQTPLLNKTNSETSL